MKKRILGIVIVFMCLNLNAQITESSNGNVGIGDTAPVFKLDVKTGTTLENGFNVSSNSTDGGKIYTTYESGRAGLNFVENDDPFVFNFLQTGFNLQLGFHHGKMGVGTASPRAMLHVNNGDNSYGSILANANEANFSLYTKTLKTQPANIESFRLGMKYDTNENNGFISFYRGSSSDDGYLGFSTSGKERIRIDKLGNVDIGTQTSGVKLEVKGYMKLNTGTSDLLLYRDNDVGNWSLLRSNTGEGIAIIGQPDRVALSVSRNTSNVGIGTKDTKGFKLGVNGKIAATEVKVATYANWPDYVFKKEYNLPSLNEVENQIKENGHLANIPSAKAVKKDGFFLGEMDAKLLQKIEELTLYTIQQEKEIKETNSNNIKLLSIIEKLEKRITKLESK